MGSEICAVQAGWVVRGVRLLRRYWQWVVIVALAAAALVLGYVGFWRLHVARGESCSVLGVLYGTLQLFTLESGNIPAPIPWELEVARYLAPLVPAWTVLKALALLFHEQSLRLRLRFYSGHVVICGLGRKGLQLVREFRACGAPVVVIEAVPDNVRLQVCRELGAVVLIGDAADTAVLRRARVFCAAYVIAVSAKDGKNVEVAVQTSELAGVHHAPWPHRVGCFVHIVDLKLCALFKRHPIFTETRDRFEASVVNIYSNVARSVLEDHPLDRERITASDGRAVHLVVVGFGHTGESMALQAARIGHYANGKKLRISVVDLHAAEKERSFYARYPRFKEVCETVFVDGDIGENETLEQVGQWAAGPESLTTILVALGSDSGSVAGALGVLSMLENAAAVPILVRMAERAALASLLSAGEKRGPGKGRVHPVGLISRVCTRKMFLNKDLDVLARAIHEDFVEKRSREGLPESDPSLQRWEQLEQTRKDSNRQQADHIPVKLRAIGCCRVEGPDRAAAPFCFSEAEIELLARMEHARWMAHRLLTGWSRGPARDPERQVSPYLVDWEDLPKAIREQNAETVRNIPKLLRLAGCRIERLETGGA